MEKKNTNFPLKLFVVVTFIIMFTVNSLSALLPLNGIMPGEVKLKRQFCDFFRLGFASR